MFNMEVVARVRKQGGSLSVLLPVEEARREGIQSGTEVRVRVEKRKKSYFGCLGPGPGWTEEDQRDREISH